MPTTLALAVLIDLAQRGVRIVRLSGGGEPLLHPGAVKVMRRAHELGLEVHLTTNGSTLSGRVLEAVVATCAVVKVSVNAGSANSYAAIHGRDHWSRARRNLLAFGEARSGTRAPRLDISCVVTRSNVADVAGVVRLAEEVGAADVRLTTDTLDTEESGHALLSQASRSIAALGATKSSVRLIASEPDELFDTDLPCPLIALMCVVGADLRVFPTCEHVSHPSQALGSLAPDRPLARVLDEALPKMMRYCLDRGPKMRKLVSSPANLALAEALTARPDGRRALRRHWAVDTR